MICSFSRSFIALFLVSSIFSQVVPPGDRQLMGFTAESSTAQRAAEARFDSVLTANNIRDWLKRLSARPHHLGSPYNKENADFIAAQFRAWGYDTKLEQFDVLFPTPKTRVVEMTSPERFTLQLERTADRG